MRDRRYIVLPGSGFRGDVLRTGHLQASGRVHLARPGAHADAEIVVLDNIGEDGPRLVEMNDDGEIALMREYAGDIRIIPLHTYERPDPEKRPERHTWDQSSSPNHSETSTQRAEDLQTWSFRTTDRDGTPIAAATIVAYTHYRWREGVSGDTDANGLAKLTIPVGTKIERVYVYGPIGHWGAYRQSPEYSETISFLLEKIDPSAANLALMKFRDNIPLTAGQGVRVGIIDTGIMRSHPNIIVAGGRNCVFDETLDTPEAIGEWDDVATHGSHVAGIVAGRPHDTCGFAGVAPSAELRAYRVFPKDGSGASNFDIMKAIEFAVADGCHIINLSLGGTFLDDAVRAAVGDARGRGVLVVAAAGNDGRKPVRYPAALESAIAVSAIGLRSSFPNGALEQSEIASPSSTADPDIFLAAFTNIGPQIKLTAPGVGIVSTVPGGFQSMSGTSMSAPLISGLAAAILSSDPYLLAAPPETRVKHLIRDLFDRALPLGFERDQEGAGLPLMDGPWRRVITAGTRT